MNLTLLGTQVQREIFEAYFEELNQQLRIPQNDSEYADRVTNLQEKIDIFNTSALCTYANPHLLYLTMFIV
jgi:predicted enzyme involved in methoxymalonyl-ACP biosynthesis